MRTIKVTLKDHPYPIVIGRNIFPQLGKYLHGLGLGESALIITSPNIRKLHGDMLINSLSQSRINASFLEVPDGEKSKSAVMAMKLLERIVRADVGKGVFLIAFGGGVIGDLTGFVASIYKRGIPYVQVPTTLLAQIDSAIGGKVAIDLSVGKNLVGAYHQPKIVFSDVSVLSTLDVRQLRNGLAEAIKYGIIADKDLFEFIERNDIKLLSRDLNSLEELVDACSRIKASIVIKDEKETKNLRTILNFGHTLGHAIEAAGKYQIYQHGEAIALGMRMAAEISKRLGMIEDRDAFLINKLLTAVGLPTKLAKISQEDILSHMQHDKKFIKGKNRFVLVPKIGSVKIVEGVSPAIIKAAIKRFS